MNEAPPRCPNCGCTMSIPDYALYSPTTCPWLCQECRRGFWEAELTAEARSTYRPQHHDWGFDEVGIAVRKAVYVELDGAMERGTPIHERHLRHVATPSLVQMAKRLDLHPGFKAALDQHLAGRPDKAAS